MMISCTGILKISCRYQLCGDHSNSFQKLFYVTAEFADRGIRVNCISPGYTKTALLIDLLQTPQGKEYGSKWKSMTPAGRFGEVTDYMGAIVFLSSEASNFMTGHDMVIDGGYSAL